MNKIICINLIFLLFQAAHGKLFQILHVNDTHSFFKETSRLKYFLDYYKKEALSQGVSTISLDAGDFSEGNLFYLAKNGRHSFNIENSMGFDAVVLGNHDFLMGPGELDTILGEQNLNYPLLAANLIYRNGYTNIEDKILPYTELNLEGYRFVIIGVTTDEFYYKWRLGSLRISDPITCARQISNDLKYSNPDMMIALTHLGLQKDKELAINAPNIDLVVGGHSHDVLEKPVWVMNMKGRPIPIFQAGMHAKYLGQIIVNVEKGKPPVVLGSRLIEIKSEGSDYIIDQIIAEAENDLDALFNRQWLREIVGKSEIPAQAPDNFIKWAYFIADSMKNKIGADVAIHTPSLDGETYPEGKITRADLFNVLPRSFDFSDTHGWHIYTARIYGGFLKSIVELLAFTGEPLAFSGMEVDYEKTRFGIRVKSISIGGRPIRLFSRYRIALSEGIVRGALAISPLTTRILLGPTRTPFFIWPTLVEFLPAKNNAIPHSLMY